MIFEVKVELGHKAFLKTNPTPNGFTHDWTVFVRGVNGIPIEHFVEKVVFFLHESFPKPKRTIKEPPFSVSESGYAGFLMPIEIHFRSKEEPKKVSFSYDMFLSLDGLVNNIRLEKMTFSNPVDEFREKLLRGGGKPKTTHRSQQREMLGEALFLVHQPASPDPRDPGGPIAPSAAFIRRGVRAAHSRSSHRRSHYHDNGFPAAARQWSDAPPPSPPLLLLFSPTPAGSGDGACCRLHVCLSCRCYDTQTPAAVGGTVSATTVSAGTQNADDQTSNKSTAAKKPKPALPGGKDTQSKPTKPPSPPSVSTSAIPKSASQPFTDIFGAPIRAKNPSDAPPKTKTPSHSKGKIAPTSTSSTSSSSNSKDTKPSKDSEKPPKDKEGHSSSSSSSTSKEHRHKESKETHSSSKDPSHHNHKDPSRAKEPHRKEPKKSSKDPSSSKEVKPPSKPTHSSKEEKHHKEKESSHHASKESKPPSSNKEPPPKEVSKEPQPPPKEKHKKEGKHSKEVRHPPKEPPPPAQKEQPKENHSSKEQQKVFKKPYPAKDPKEAHRTKTSHGSSKEVVPSPKPAKEPPTVGVEAPSKPPKPVVKPEKPPKKRSSPDDSRPAHGQPEKKKKKPSTPPPEPPKPSPPPPPPAMVKQEAKKPKQKGEDRSRADSHVSVKKEKEKPREPPPKPPKPPSPPLPPPKSPSPAFDYGGYSSDSNDSKDSKKSTSVRAQYSSPASSISETSLDGSLPFTMNVKREIISPLTSDSEMSLSPPASPKHNNKSSSESPESRPVSRMSSESPSNSPKRRSSSESPHSSPRVKHSPCSDSSSSSASRDSDSSESDAADSPPASKRYHDNELSNHKSAKRPYKPPTSPVTLHYQEYLRNAGHYAFKATLDYDDFKRWREELMIIQKRIECTEDRRLLQKIVDLIEKTGNYEISSNTFDFDLCMLDISTLKKVKHLVNSFS